MAVDQAAAQEGAKGPFQGSDHFSPAAALVLAEQTHGWTPSGAPALQAPAPVGHGVKQQPGGHL